MAFFGDLFLGVGAMKAGTTWLYALLSRHPELHFTPEKEIHYFYHRYVDNKQLKPVRRLREARNRYLLRFDPDKANISRVRRNLRWISAYLDSPVDDFWYRNLFLMQDGQRYVCDFSNLNTLLPVEVWPKISAKCDTLRVLYAMRDPVRRLWSHTKFHLHVSGEAECLHTWKRRDYERFLRQPHIWEHAEYGSVLRRLKAGIGADDLKVMFYEDIHADRRAALAEIEEFLGVAHHSYPETLLDQRFTKSVTHEMPDFFSDILAPDVERIRAEVQAEGFALPESWR